MHTSNISAVLPVAPKNAAQTPNDGHADSTSPDASFSSVLTRQNGNEPVRETTSSGHRSTDKKGASDTQGDPASSSDAALVQEAAEQGLTLPQIALNIASEVAAVRQSGLANALKSHGITEPTTRNAAHAERDIHTLLSRLPADATPKTTAATAREQLGTELAAKAKILPDALPTDRSKGMPTIAQGLAPQPTPLVSTVLSTGRAASIAGAKQAVLTMQARMQAADNSLPKPSTTFPEVFTALTSATGDLRTAPFQADAGAHQALITTALPGATAGLLAMSPNPIPTPGAQIQLPGIAAPLQSPQWAAELGRQVVTITQGGHNMPQTAELRLDPPELGPLRISINLNDNVAHAVFVSAHASVRQSVENALPQLQQMLAQAGISLGQTSVNDQGQPGQAFNEASGQGRGHSGSGQNGGNSADNLVIPLTTRAPAPNALVDTFA